ncbi:MAG TPA: hypothetical protein VME70_02585 [Mycobacteriales bacterium]|nr:hypothetical protein [Mycobacteriales bacterium]
MFGPDFRLPERGLLLHVGPHKTGTTAIQGALHNARSELAEYGVVYAGRRRQSQMAALAVTQGHGLAGDRPAQLRDWERLVEQAEATADQRFVISSEYFDGASDEVAAKVVNELGGERVHVVVTLRPLALIVPSAWQQYVRNRFRAPYRRWLKAMLEPGSTSRATPSFWYRHHHDAQVERWASIVGPERLVVVVADESDRESLLRTFERFVGVPEGLLRAEVGHTNRSLTAPEIELIRAINVEFHQRELPPRLYYELVYDGIARQMQLRTPDPGEPRITLPGWGVERANEVAAAAAERIAASGVGVIGDLASLSAVKPLPDDQQTDMAEVELSVAGAAQALLGAILASERLLAGQHGPEAQATPVKPSDLTTRRLLGELVRRRRRVAKRLRRAVGRA